MVNFNAAASKLLVKAEIVRLAENVPYGTITLLLLEQICVKMTNLRNARLRLESEHH